MKVIATENYEKYNLKDKELKRIPKEGEEFEVTPERYKVLAGENKQRVAFVKPLKPTTNKKVKDEK